MAFLYIKEYDRLAREEHGGPGGTVQAGVEPALAEHVLAISGSSVAMTEPFTPETRFIMVHTDTICHIKFGKEPSANDGNQRLPADATMFFGIRPTAELKLAVKSGT